MPLLSRPCLPSSLIFFLTDHETTGSVSKNEHHYPLWMLMDWSIAVSLAVLACILGASVAGGTLVSWKVHRRALSLEYRVSDLEERLTTTQKRSAAQARWEKPDKLALEAEALRNLSARRTVPDDPPWFQQGA